MHQISVGRVLVDPQQRPRASRVGESARLRSTAIRTTTFLSCPTRGNFQSEFLFFHIFQERLDEINPKTIV